MDLGVMREAVVPRRRQTKQVGEQMYLLFIFHFTILRINGLDKLCWSCIILLKLDPAFPEVNSNHDFERHSIRPLDNKGIPSV